ncbi:MAG: CaiB/BaiF CoA transferase family protein, partial [Solirubrobacteraceae bacterium]
AYESLSPMSSPPSLPPPGPPPSGPLAGLLVADFSRVLAGPYCTMLLADLGAEVIKVEPPEGDDSRLFGPFVGDDCAYFRLVNRGKRGITLDLKREPDRELLAGLAERSDILIENYRPGTLERLGLGIGELRARNPRLIVISISGFGHTGPLGGAAAYDLIAQAFSGLMSVTGWEAERPTRCGVSLGDMIPGLYGALAAVAALHERARTGRGQHVDLAMVDSLISVLESVSMRALHSDEPIVPCGNDHAQTTPLGTYAAADGPVAIGVSNDRLFERLATALHRSDWLADPRFMPYPHRLPNREALRAEIEGELRRMTVAETVALLTAAGVPAAPVHDVRAALAHPQVRARGIVVQEEDGFETIASPIRLRGSVKPHRAPALGEHNELIDGWLAEPARI